MTTERSAQWGHRFLLVGAGVAFWVLVGWNALHLGAGVLLATAALVGLGLWSLAALIDGPPVRDDTQPVDPARWRGARLRR